MLVKLQDLVDIADALEAIQGAKGLKAAAGFELATRRRLTEGPLKDAIAQRLEVIKKYAPETMTIPKDDPNHGVAVKEIQDLYAVEVDIALLPIPIDDIADAQDVGQAIDVLHRFGLIIEG
jgi:hypothetical protein